MRTASPRSARSAERRPIDTLLGVYAIVSGSVLLLPGRPAAWPILAARAEDAWLAGDLGAVRAKLEDALRWAVGARDQWAIGDIARWLAGVYG